MANRAPIVGLAILLAAAAGSPAQELPPSPRLSFRDITLNLRDGTVVRGRLSGATAQPVLVRPSGVDRSFVLSDHGLPGQKIGLGNGSIGFLLGYHF